MIHRISGRARVSLLSNKCIPSRSRGLLHVLALELLRLPESAASSVTVAASARTAAASAGFLR